MAARRVLTERRCLKANLPGHKRIELFPRWVSRGTKIIDSPTFWCLKQQRNGRNHIFQMDQVHAVLPVCHIRFPRQKTPGMTFWPHQPREAEDIHGRPRQLVQPVFQLFKHFATGGDWVKRGRLFDVTLAVTIHGGRAGKYNTRHGMRERAVDNFLHRLQIKIIAFTAASGGKRHH
ncbi:hypothetical protein BBAD15_g43 [Beauveria bassiana D1-5]|uniref:Uncharacterized protein n=1 Tax=Beauveria bassiana D1-5 TaxID=1245745 RepID=A0A0A2W1H9_BEABA|nr:hypothetical protein BBAD15_g43 [Beauveria bassiana D1-5]